MSIRIADGRARVVREIRAAAPLMSRLAVPLTSRGPWLTAALNAQPARVRARAVVVEPHLQGRPDGLALLALRRRGPATAVTLLGTGPGPLPEGRPQCRLYAPDPETAGRLADGVLDLLAGLRGPWTLRLAGLPLGDPTLGRLAAGLPDATTATTRSRRLVDELDAVGEVYRSTDPAALERVLPALLCRVPADQRSFVRAAARLHAAIGWLEVAVVRRGDDVAALLLTLLDRGPDGTDRWPWWGWSDGGGLRRKLGSPWASLTASGGLVSLTRRGVHRAGVSRGTAAG
ncbi:hypothetical protein [Modestobacter marinus]|uniref:hypothetical protein n=1 Tax=Modestobacter marinus TaxID=477641 RepID=UPI001C93D7F5|nr:hypothetical protein [Modestobacter marinus]